MPPDNGLGLDNGQPISPVGPDSGQDDPKGPVSVRQAGPFRISFQDIELMPEREVFQDRRAMGPQNREEPSEEDEYHRSDGIIQSS